MTTPLSTVWVLMQGERSEGGDVLGVFATRDAAKGKFLSALASLPFEVNHIWRDGDTDAAHVEAGCDWLSLEPHEVRSQSELEAQ